ncbi:MULTISPECIES: hypothetical protein [unclassified Ruegeria]|uniref:hypothetical protein n=1 Tax=unclassified Ruegeria TaxID=2625375 RepID=UPI001492A0A4|nr:MULTISPECIES: hypothetical protein [unclassified Ruegeria]NOD34308.1 hypothetical protein [Ruegeria sp. HKCCD7296]NOE41332.1 hypothetical protein [Ruegeria sp. HKCCD7319]
MKNVGLISTILFLSTFGGTASSETLGADCVKIESDIARLECFDSAFGGMKLSPQSPEQSFSKFESLINFSGPNERVWVTLHNCGLRANRVTKPDWVTNNPGGISYNAAAFYVDLRNVDVEKSRPALRQPQNIYLVTKRDGYVSIFPSSMNFNIDSAESNITPLAQFEDVESHFETVSQQTFAHEWSGAREMYFPLIPQSYYPDGAEIQNALVELASSCQQ